MLDKISLVVFSNRVDTSITGCDSPHVVETTLNRTKLAPVDNLHDRRIFIVEKLVIFT
jgi:hypothetical protein